MKKVEFKLNGDTYLNCNVYEVYTELQGANGNEFGLIGFVCMNEIANRYGFQPTHNELITYSEFTLRKIANFVSKLNKKEVEE